MGGIANFWSEHNRTLMSDGIEKIYTVINGEFKKH